MTKDTAQRTVNRLAAKAIGYMDQGLGHGHYGFIPLEQDEFVELYDALETLGEFEQVKSSERK